MANPFASWTADQVRAHNARVSETKGGRVRSTIASMTVGQMEKILVGTATPKKNKPLLNRTESLFHAELLRRGHKIVLCQAVMLRLGEGCQYRPDFVVITPTFHGSVLITCYETKAPHRFKAAGITKVKCAAHQYPWITFKIIMRDKSVWTEQTVGV